MTIAEELREWYIDVIEDDVPTTYGPYSSEFDARLQATLIRSGWEMFAEQGQIVISGTPTLVMCVQQGKVVAVMTLRSEAVSERR